LYAHKFIIILPILQQMQSRLTHTNCISGGNAVRSAFTQSMQNLLV